MSLQAVCIENIWERKIASLLNMDRLCSCHHFMNNTVEQPLTGHLHCYIMSHWIPDFITVAVSWWPAAVSVKEGMKIIWYELFLVHPCWTHQIAATLSLILPPSLILHYRILPGIGVRLADVWLAELEVSFLFIFWSISYSSSFFRVCTEVLTASAFMVWRAWGSIHQDQGSQTYLERAGSLTMVASILDFNSL
jgi:hypothetical protein